MLTIVTGGQTGVDRAALDAALSLGVPVAGWCPAGRVAEDGPIPVRYPLRETPSEDSAQRTEWNVERSDGLLVLTSGHDSPGTELAIRTALAKNHPVRQQSVYDSTTEALTWLDRNHIQVLNVAGPRESEAPGLYKLAHTWMLQLLGSYLVARVKTS